MSDHLSASERRELRERLERDRDELGRGLTGATKSAKPVDLDQPIGRVSRIDAIQQQQMAQEQRRRLRLRLQRTEAAIVAFDEDAYGSCNGCDEPIPYRRLKARPETPLCLTCQSGSEHR